MGRIFKKNTKKFFLETHNLESNKSESPLHSTEMFRSLAIIAHSVSPRVLTTTPFCQTVPNIQNTF